MPIRFFCPSCSRPIEIDDEWANRTVVCPFCRAAVTAPANSAPDMESVNLPAQQETRRSAPEPPSPNLVAITAFVAILLAVVLLVFAGVTVAPHADELTEVTKAAEHGNHQATMEAVQLFLEHHGGPPPWMLHAMMLFMGGVFAWLAALVCGVLGMRGKCRRGFAVAALMIAVGIPILLCCGGGLSGG